MSILKYLALLIVLTLTLAAVACSSDSDNSAERADSGETVTAGGKLSANNASDEELEAAFEAAGILNADLWADEVDDTDFTKLRGELAKYKPGPGVVDSIIDLLELP